MMTKKQKSTKAILLFCSAAFYSIAFCVMLFVSMICIQRLPKALGGQKFIAKAAENILPVSGESESGTMQWEISADGCLTVTGSGDYDLKQINFGSDSDPTYISGPEWLNYADSIQTAVINVTGITSTKNMFYYCTNMKTVDLSGLETSSVTNMFCMFQGCSSLNKLDISNFNTRQVTDMSSMFTGCWLLSSLELKGDNFKTDKVTNMSRMFSGCSGLNALDVSFFDTSRVTNMDYMFDDCSSLNALDVSSFNTSQVTDMNGMFETCSSLTLLELSNFNTSQVTDMGGIFAECSSLNTLGISNLDTSKAMNMSHMFAGCSSLTSLNLSNLDTSKATNMAYMFAGCSSLTSLDVSNFDTSKVTDMSRMFSWCSNLASLNLSNFSTSQVTDMGGMFAGSSLTSLNLSKFDTSKVTSMDFMFSYCSSLTSLNLSKFDTSKVTFMNDMFWGCSSLTSLDLSNFNTSQVTDMSEMFGSCSSLTSLDLSNFNVSQVTDMDFMFSHCSSLRSLTVSNFNAGSATTMTHMFFACGSLSSLNLSNFDTGNVTDMSYMFRGCSNLKTLELNGSKFDTSQVTNMAGMFWGCNSLSSLDVNNFNTSNVTDMSGMFGDCSSLNLLDLSKFDTSRVTNMSSMFTYCRSLKELDIRNFDLKSAQFGFYEYGDRIFDECTVLELLNFCADAPFSVTLPQTDGYFWIDENKEICTQTAAQLSRKMTYRKIRSDSLVPSVTDDINTGIFSDNAYTAFAPLSMRTHFINGGNVRQSDGAKLNFKTKYYYTKLLASNIVTTDKKGKTKTKAGKLVAGITSSADKPVLSKGKIVDTTASKTASASIRKDRITVTAKTQPGTVYLWVIDTGDAAAFAYAKIVVKAVPSKLQTFAVSSNSAGFSPDSKNAYKKDTVELGQTVDLYLYPTYSLNRTATETKDASYSVEVPSQYSSYVTAVQDAGNPYCFHVTANALKNNKKTTGKVIITCKENGKKASFTVTAVNSVQSIDILPQSGMSVVTAGAAVCELSMERSDTDKKTGSFSISISKSSNDFETTDAVKLYVMGTADGFDRAQMEKGKVKITAKPSTDQKKLTAKLERDKKTVTATAAKKIPSGTSVYYLIMYNKKENTGYKIVKLTAV